MARYEPGQPSGDLMAVARMADLDAELAEDGFSGETVLLVRWENYNGDQPFTDWTVVRPGRYLAYSEMGDSLSGIGDAGLRQWYDLVPGG